MKLRFFRETVLFLKGHNFHSALFNFLIFTMKPRLFLNPWALAVFLPPSPE